jgi:hypothetical protein
MKAQFSFLVVLAVLFLGAASTEEKHQLRKPANSSY